MTPSVGRCAPGIGWHFRHARERVALCDLHAVRKWVVNVGCQRGSSTFLKRKRRRERAGRRRLSLAVTRSMCGFRTGCRHARAVGRVRFLIGRWRRRRRVRSPLTVGRVRSAVTVRRRIGASVGIGVRRGWRRRRCRCSVRATCRARRIRRRSAVRFVRRIRRFVAPVRQARLRRRLVGTPRQRQQQGRQPERRSYLRTPRFGEMRRLAHGRPVCCRGLAGSIAGGAASVASYGVLGGGSHHDLLARAVLVPPVIIMDWLDV